jgi:hypothetical protein
VALLRLIPPVDYIRSTSPAELKLAKILSQIESNSDSAAYHSVHLPEHSYKRMSEIDFVVLWEGVVVVLEVKGGRVRREEGSWFFTDRFGNANSRSESPWQQARSAMFALRERVMRALPDCSYEYVAVVVMPDQVMAEDLEWERHEFIGPTQMSIAGVKDALESAARHARRGKSPSDMPSFSPIKKVLRPDFDLLPSLSVISSRINEKMNQIAAEQIEVLEGLDSNDRVLVEGGAGTGKTLLALEAARRASSDGAKVLFLSSSPAIVELASDQLAESNVHCSGMESLPTWNFDLVVVDEGQDMANQRDLRKIESVVTGGLDGGRWWYFADPNNQVHVSGRFETEAYRGLRERAACYSLRRNHRNTANIVECVKVLLRADLGAPRIGAGPVVQFPKANGAQDLVAHLDAWLDVLPSEGLSASDIHFVSLARSKAESLVWKTKWGRQGKISNTRRANQATLWTPSEIKGLEVDHVVILDVEDMDAIGATSGFYVALTRARVSLWVGLSPQARAQLDAEATRNLLQDLKGKDS